MARTAAARANWQNEMTWPNLAQTASFLAVDPSTLSKQAEKGRVLRVKRGLGRKKASLVPPREVLRLALAIGRVPLEEVKKRMAGEAARRLQADEGALLRELDQLDLAPEEAAIDVPREEAANGEPLLALQSPEVTEGLARLRRRYAKRITAIEDVRGMLDEALGERSMTHELYRMRGCAE